MYTWQLTNHICQKNKNKMGNAKTPQWLFLFIAFFPVVFAAPILPVILGKRKLFAVIVLKCR
jgi:hypothetical protein